MEDFLDWAQRLEGTSPHSVMVVDSKGRIVFHSKEPERAMQIDFASTEVGRLLSEARRGVAIVLDPVRREEVVSAYAPVGKYRWGIVVDEPVRAAFAPRDQQMRRLLMAYGLTLLMVAAVLYMGSQLLGVRKRFQRDRQMQLELETRVAERTAELEATNKELESFSYSVSHDLRSPLRAITGFARMLDEDYAGTLDAEARRMLNVIRDNGEKMGRLIDDLLSFSRLGRKPIECAETDMRALVEEVLAEITHGDSEVRHKVSITELPTAWCDRRLMAQVWMNLLSNAYKFTARVERPMILVSGVVEGETAVYSVRDNGAGFDMRYYDKLFGVFQRLHSEEQFAGTGVGLAIVQRVVTRHGGRVWAEGKPGEGAVFHFTVPRKPGEPA